MNKCFAIAACFGFVVLSVSNVEAGLFGRRSSGGRCSGGNCSAYSVPSYTTPLTKVSTPTASKTVAKPTETRTTVSKPVIASVPASTVSQVESPSDLSIPQASPAPSSRVIYHYQSSPCANGRCYSNSRRRR